MDVKGIVTVAGHQFNMPVESGIGLVLLDGRWTLIEFTTPLESLPPRGEGVIIGTVFILGSVRGVLVVVEPIVFRGDYVYVGEPRPGKE